MYLGTNHLAESANYDSAIDSINESFSFKPLFSKIKGIKKDLAEKLKSIFKKDNHSGTDKPVEEFFSFDYDDDPIDESDIDNIEEAFGFTKKVSYSDLIKWFDYTLNSIDYAIDFEATVMNLAITNAEKILNCKSDGEAATIYNNTIKKINELSKEHNGKVNKTCEYSKETNACLKDRCKSIKKYLSEEDIKKLIDYCKKGITRLEKATSTASKKIDPCIDKEKALGSKFQDMSYKIEFKQRTILCAQLMCNAYENFAYREVQYTLNDIKLTKDDFNYICECCH